MINYFDYSNKGKLFFLSVLISASLSSGSTHGTEHAPEPSVGLSVCRSAKYWGQNGWADPDVIWGCEWVGRGMGVLDINGLLGESKIDRFHLDVGRIIGNFDFSFVPMGTFGMSISS